MGGKYGISDDGVTLRKKRRKNDQQYRNDQHAFQKTESGAANSIKPPHKSNVQHIFDYHPDKADNKKYDTKNDQKARYVQK